MTNSLSEHLIKAQEITEQIKNDLPLSEESIKNVRLQFLAKDIFCLLEKDQIEANNASSSLGGRCTALPTARDEMSPKEYAQKCVLEFPELFPYFVQIFPDLSRSLKEMIDLGFKRISQLDSDLLISGPIIETLKKSYLLSLCRSLPVTKDALEMFLNKIDKETTIVDWQKHKAYGCLAEIFDEHNLLINYITSNPNVNPDLAIAVAELKLEGSPSDVVICLNAFTKAKGWGSFPTSLSSQILEIKNVSRQENVLGETTSLLERFAKKEISPEQFSFLMENEYVSQALKCLKPCNCISQTVEMLKVAKNEGARRYAAKSFETLRANCAQNGLELLPNYAVSILHLLSYAYSEGTSEEMCNALFQQACAHFKNEENSKELEMYLSVLRDIVSPHSIDRESRSYLLSKIIKETSLMPCIHVIWLILELNGAAHLDIEVLEVASLYDIFWTLCQSATDKELGAAPALIQIQPSLTNIDPEEAKMLTDIFNSDGFKKEAERDGNREHRERQTVAEVQGTTSLCKKTVEHAIGTPSVLSPPLLKALQDVNPDLSLALRYKRVGHAFNLDGMVPLPNGSMVCLTGFNETFVIPMLRDMFDKFIVSQKADIREDLNFVKQALAKAIWHDNASDERINEAHGLLNDPDYPYPVVVSSGWDWHSTQAILVKNIFLKKIVLYYCNRGADCSNIPGIYSFEIIDKDKITPEFLKRIASRLSVDRSEYTTLMKIMQELGSSVSGGKYYPMKKQRVGNCVYANAKAAIYALLLIQSDLLLAKAVDSLFLGNPEAQTNATAQAHLIDAKQIYKAFSQFDKETVLKDFLIDLEQAKGLSLEENKNYLTGLTKIADVVEQWALKHRGKDKVSGDLLTKTIYLTCLKDWAEG